MSTTRQRPHQPSKGQYQQIEILGETSEFRFTELQELIAAKGLNPEDVVIEGCTRYIDDLDEFPGVYAYITEWEDNPNYEAEMERYKLDLAEYEQWEREEAVRKAAEDVVRAKQHLERVLGNVRDAKAKLRALAGN
jgi:hypothetical protein